MTFFNIIVPLYNAEKWIQKCLRSIRFQDYSNYKVVIVNDCSTDNSVNVIQNEIKGLDNFHLITTPENGGALNSVITGVEYACPNDEDVIAVLDGDDWFAKKNSLSILNEAYTNKDCLMTYGSYVEYPVGVRGKFSKQLPEDVIKNKSFRQSEWMTSHMRTYKYKLWCRVKREDVVHQNGDVYRMAGDLPVMFPMLEMAEERSHFIEDIIYVYNRINPLNEDKVNHGLQLSIESEVRAKPKYKRLEEEVLLRGGND